MKANTVYYTVRGIFKTSSLKSAIKYANNIGATTFIAELNGKCEAYFTNTWKNASNIKNDLITTNQTVEL